MAAAHLDAALSNRLVVHRSSVATRRCIARLLGKLSIVLIFFGFAVRAHAWGWTGHAVVAYIAEARITPEVHRRVMQLLASDRSGLADSADIGEQAAWADQYRDASPGGRSTRQWHFVDLNRRRPSLIKACFGRRPPPSSVPASEGPEAACVVDKLIQFRNVLGDPSQSAHERLRALQFVLHLVGDIHQPMHAITDDDAGGNDIRVSTGRGRAESLHHLWDTTLVERLGPILVDGYVPADRLTNARAIADALLAQIDRAEDQLVSVSAVATDRAGRDGLGRARTCCAGESRARPGRAGEGTAETGRAGSYIRDLRAHMRFDPEAWAWESYDIARKQAYAPLRRRGASSIYRLGKRDEAQALAAVATQLARAGVRLASVLDDALGDPQPAVR